MSVITSIIRKNFRESDRKRDEGLKTPDGIRRYDNIQYGEDDKTQILDVYRPADEEGSLPVIVSIHGGGWVYGDKEVYQFYCMNLAERGFAVINFTYRLAPENKFPAALEDANLVFHWLFAHAEEYGFDTKNIFAVGDSAGGHLLALYTVMCTNPVFAGKFTFNPPKGFVPNAVALNCGVYKITKDRKTDKQTRMLLKELLKDKGTKEELDLINPIPYVTEHFPPAFVMTATDDFLIAHAPLMTARLTEVKVPFVYRLYGSAAEPLQHVFHCNFQTKDAKLCNDEECAFFRSYMV